MNEGASDKRVAVQEGWNQLSRGAHDIANLRNLLSHYTKEAESMSELAIEGERPIIIKRTETNDMVVELSAAFKSGLEGKIGTRKGVLSPSGGIKTAELRSLFEELESPAVTTEEVAKRLGCPPSEAVRHLIELDHRGWIAHKQSGDTTIWWPADEDTEAQEQESEDGLPDYIREGLEQSEEDIREWIKQNQREDESMEDTYERIRGNPSPDEVEEMIIGGESNMAEIMKQVKRKKRSEKDRKSKLRDLFG